MTFFTILLLVALVAAYNTLIVVKMRETCIVERLGKFHAQLKPGIHFLIPFFDRIAYRHEIREQVLDIPSQSCITRDNIQVEVDGILYLKIIDPKQASYGIESYQRAAINLAQTTMRSEVGKLTLADAFSERDTLNDRIVKELDSVSNEWGTKVLRYEIMNIRPSAHVISTLEQQMEAEREKRAEITLATAEKESRINISEGKRLEAINISEGKKQKTINEAKGRAKEIELLAEATSSSIAFVANAINTPGGEMAVKLQLVDQFLKELGNILSNSNISVLPADMANIKGVFEGFNQVTNPLRK